MANLLTWGPSFCFHEAIPRCVRIDDLQNMFDSTGCQYVGDADPAAGLFALEINRSFPKSRFVFINRPEEECVESEFRAMIEDGSPQFLGTTKTSIQKLVHQAAKGLDDLYRSLPVERKIFTSFAELGREDTIKWIWKFCLPHVEFPLLRYKMLDGLRVTQIFGKAAPTVSNETILERKPTHA